MECSNLSYDQIKIGNKFEFEKTITTEEIDLFSKLTGDYSPLHSDGEYAKKTQFKGRLVHGLHAAGLFSTIIGMMCPGEKNLCLSQTFNYKKPIYPNQKLLVRGTVTGKSDSIKVVTVKLEIISKGIVLINGEARLTVRDK